MITRVITTTIEIKTVETFTGLPGGAESFTSEEAFAAWLNAHPVLFNPEGAWRGGEWQSYKQFYNDMDEIAVYTSVPQQLDQVESLVRYFLEGAFAGECYGVKAPGAVDGMGQLFIIHTDSTKSRHDDWTMYMDSLWTILQSGSPIRKTDRKGPGTKGTRAVEGLGCDIWLAFR